MSFRVGDTGDFVSTGSEAVPDPRTGRPVPRLVVSFPGGTPRTTLYVTYRDLSGRDAGPFPLQFDPAVALAKSDGLGALEQVRRVHVL